MSLRSIFTNNIGSQIQKGLARLSEKKLMSQIGRRPIVSFTFDDFPFSAVHVGGTMLSRYNLKGTYYASLGLMGQTTVVGEMFKPSDLQSLLASGHELACHTYNHTRACDVEITELLAQCERNRTSISDLCHGYKCRNFSFPEGVVTVRAKSALNQVYDTCRTVEPGINCDPLDFGFLRANPVYSSIPITAIKDKIRQNEEKRGWVILYTHDICATPSAYGCTPEYFREVLQYTVDSGADILTVAQATQRFSSSPSA